MNKLKRVSLGQNFWQYKQREIDSWLSLNQPESDCNYHFPIDLAPNGNLISNQSENGKQNPIAVMKL